jgi:hypothetical protein
MTKRKPATAVTVMSETITVFIFMLSTKRRTAIIAAARPKVSLGGGF